MKKQKPRVKKGFSEPSKFTPHEAGILLEEIRDQVKLVAEAVEAVREEMGGKIDATAKYLKEDMRNEMLTINYRIEARILESRQDMQAYLVEMKQDLRKELIQKIDRCEARLDRHEGQITHLQEAQG